MNKANLQDKFFHVRMLFFSITDSGGIDIRDGFRRRRRAQHVAQQEGVYEAVSTSHCALEIISSNTELFRAFDVLLP